MKKTYDIVNNTPDKGFFKAFIPLSQTNGKANIFEKSVNGTVKKYLQGIATNTQVDKEDERMSKSFIQKIKANCLGLNVFAEHEHSIDKTVGYIDDVSGDDDNVMMTTALEDEEDNPIVKSVLKKIAHGTQIGYSIGGRILKAKKSFDENLKKYINEIEDGEIYEVSLTAMPAGMGTWVQPIQKSMKELMNTKEVKDQIHDEPTEDGAVKLTKALDELVQGNKLQQEMWDIFYAFRNCLYNILQSDVLTPEERKTKILELSTEFGTKVEELSTKIAELSATVEEQLGTSESE